MMEIGKSSTIFRIINVHISLFTLYYKRNLTQTLNNRYTAKITSKLIYNASEQKYI